MSKENRVLADLDRHSIALEHAKLNEIVLNLNKAMPIITKITDGKIKEVDAVGLDNFIAEKTGFNSNLYASADLLGFKAEYTQVTEILKKITISEFGEFDLENGMYSISEKQYADLNEKFSTYLQGGKLKAYNDLIHISDLLNALTDKRQSQALIQRGDEARTYEVSPEFLHQLI